MKCMKQNKARVMQYSRLYSLDFRRKWLAAKRTKSRFLDWNKTWLDRVINFACVKTKTTGRPKSEFQNLSYSGKFRRTEQLRKTETSELIFATELRLRSDGRPEAAKLLSRSRTVLSPNQEIKKNNQTTSKNAQSPLSSDQALALFLDAKLTKRSYQLLRNNAKENNFDIYPSYNKIREAKQLCYPENISAQEHSVVLPLQSLLDHTTCRLLSTLDLENQHFENLNFTLITKWGMDGSSGQNEYKQAFEGNYSDSNLLLTCLVPLQLNTTNGQSAKIYVWQNPHPASTVYCRPLKMQFLKETIEISKKEKSHMDQEILNLSPTNFRLKNNSVILVKHELYMSMVDNKMINSITGTSSQKCYLCGASPIEMNDIDAVLKRTVDKNHLSFGITSLHAWIRSFECILKISYRLQIQKWQARGDDKNVIKQEKNRIQAAFRSRLGIIVDQTKQGAGTTNDGNTARTFFQNYKVSAEITNIDENLIYRIYVILQVIASGFDIKIREFKYYCIATGRLFLHLYPWYRIPASLHKIFIHSAEIIKSVPVPIGQLSEEAQEARNKEYRRAREQNSRKCNRVSTNRDVFNYLLVTSDPKITSLRKHSTPKKKIFCPEALNMFKSFKTTSSNHSSDDDSD